VDRSRRTGPSADPRTIRSSAASRRMMATLYSTADPRSPRRPSMPTSTASRRSSCRWEPASRCSTTPTTRRTRPRCRRRRHAAEYEDAVHMWVVIGPDIPESLEVAEAGDSSARTRLTSVDSWASWCFHRRSDNTYRVNNTAPDCEAEENRGVPRSSSSGGAAPHRSANGRTFRVLRKTACHASRGTRLSPPPASAGRSASGSHRSQSGHAAAFAPLRRSRPSSQDGAVAHGVGDRHQAVSASPSGSVPPCGMSPRSRRA
jgi:hypothetical protein